MGLRFRLQWFDKITELGEGIEFSDDFGNDSSLMTDELGLATKDIVNNGCFDIKNKWVKILQPYFKHKIDQSVYDYQISFDYRDKW